MTVKTKAMQARAVPKMSAMLREIVKNRAADLAHEIAACIPPAPQSVNLADVCADLRLGQADARRMLNAGRFVFSVRNGGGKSLVSVPRDAWARHEARLNDYWLRTWHC